jgi:hypothetical protein
MKKLSRDEMKKVMGGKIPSGKECSANCNPGFVTISDCDGTCISTEDVGVTCGGSKMCCGGSGNSCQP